VIVDILFDLLFYQMLSFFFSFSINEIFALFDFSMLIDSVMFSHAALDLTKHVKQRKIRPNVQQLVTLYDDDQSQFYLTISEIY
jgi:hypothetical protein